MSTTHRSKEDRKDQIINAALECFLVQGYVNTTIDNIAEKSHLSKGSVYWYFKSKDDILIESIIVFTQIFEQELMLIEKEAGPAVHKLKAGIEGFVKFQEQNKGLFNLFVEFWAQSKDRDEVKIYWVRLLTIFKESITNIIKKGIEAKEFNEIDATQFSWALMATLDGLGAYGALVDDLDIEKIMNVYTEILLKGLGYKI